MMSLLQLRRYRPLTLLVIGGLSLWLILSAWPPSSARALEDETGFTEYIYNTQSDFARGVFQRTVVAASPASPTNPDQIGSVELAPVGALNRNQWRATADLPQPLSDAALVALDRYLFVVGGATSPNANEENRSRFVYRAEVVQDSGSLVSNETPYPNGNAFFQAFEIPGIDPGPDCDLLLNARSRAGAVAVPDSGGSNLGYIFVVGGSVYDQNCQTYDFSLNVVQRATVNSSGLITAWSAPDNWRFPTLDDNGNIITNPNSPDLRGVQNVQIAYVRTNAGKDFIYVIGGLSIAPGQFSQEDLYPFVFYTQVAANGNLVNPDNPTNPNPPTVWKRLNDLPFGLHSGTAIATRATRVESGVPVQKDAIFLLGGCTAINCSTLNTAVWRADVNPDTGALTWTNQVAKTSGGGAQSISIQGRQGVTGLSFNNRLYYVTGSTSTGSPGASGATATIPVAIYDDSFLLEDLTESNTYFVGTDETNDYVLPQPNRRLNASVALVPAVPPAGSTSSVNAAWIFVAGGSNESNQPQSTIFVGGVGGANETTSAVRAPEGWYYSQPFSVLTEGETSRLLALKWLTSIERPATNPDADIEVQFRAVVTSGTCRESDFNPSTASTNPSRWRILDGDPGSALRSINGENTVRLITAFPDEEIQATCMQFRARLIQDPGNRTISPKLYYFAVEKVVAARPDILIDTFNVQTVNGQFSNIVLTLRNLRNNSLAATRSVVAATGDGGFFVDLCIARRSNPSTPALTAVPPPDPNASNTALPECATVSAQVPKSAMGAGATYTVSLSDWLDAQTTGPANWSQIFAEPGIYDIGIVVDYTTFTGEDAQGRSNNRGENISPPNGIIRTIEILPPSSGINVYVPVIYR